MTNLPASELLPWSGSGRSYTAERTVRLGDVDVAGLARFDSLARYLQDVASDDALEADLPNAMGWVVRRTMMRVDEPCRLNERITLTTFCTGAGRAWAERRTSISGALGSAVEAVSLWVQVDPASGRPVRLGPEFFELYGPSAAGRVVSSKLTLPTAPIESTSTPWRFRTTDVDPFDHVNNAAQWAVLESVLGDSERRGTAVLEYVAAVDLSEVALVADGRHLWLVDGDRTVSAMAWSPSV